MYAEEIMAVYVYYAGPVTTMATLTELEEGEGYTH